MDLVALTASAIGLLGTATKASEKILRLKDGSDDVRQIEFDVEVSHHKFQVWQENWSGQAQHPDVSAEALWGVQGWHNIRRMLNAIIDASKHIETYLRDARESQSTQPRSRWMAAVKALRSKKGPSTRLQELQKLAAALSRSVDELWIYSETVFDSLHGILAHETRLPEREKLLSSALQSRAGSLDLYWLCSISTMDCSLEMDLLDAGAAWSRSFNDRGNPPLRLFYHLFTQARELELQKLVVESVPEAEVPSAEMGEVIEPGVVDLQIFTPRLERSAAMVKVSHYGSSPQSYLRIPQTPVVPVHLKSNPESLARVLGTLDKAPNLSTQEHFSTGAKVELAYKVIECGFFLLGTPWFSSLSSKNLLRLKRAERERPSFMLEIQTLDINDLLFDDPGALAETSQLFRIGVLLMEIALDEPDYSSRTEDYGHDAERISKLPLIEQAMGTQYCKATAFCLQHRPPRRRFRGPEKYDSKHFDDWKSYLAEFLQEYHSQVFLRYVLSSCPSLMLFALTTSRLQELREVDTKSEYRSVKSWQGANAD